MLGTPPAFVLSQDQTLKKLYLKPEGFKSSFWINLSSKYYSRISLAVIIRFRHENSNNPLIVQGVHFVFALFSLQGTAVRRCELLYISRWTSICQELFYPCLKFFCLLTSRFFAVHRTAWKILSHRNLFVKNFFHFLWDFFVFLFRFVPLTGALRYTIRYCAKCQALFFCFSP